MSFVSKINRSVKLFEQLLGSVIIIMLFSKFFRTGFCSSKIPQDSFKCVNGLNISATVNYFTVAGGGWERYCRRSFIMKRCTKCKSTADLTRNSVKTTRD